MNNDQEGNSRHQEPSTKSQEFSLTGVPSFGGSLSRICFGMDAGRGGFFVEARHGLQIRANCWKIFGQ